MYSASLLMLTAVLGAEPFFADVSEHVGLSGVAGHFISAADYNNDGYVDLLVDGHRLFRNLGPPEYMFRDAADEAGLEPLSSEHEIGHAVFGDFDNDGCPDLFATSGKFDEKGDPCEPILWRNKCDGTFEDVTERSKIANPYPAQAAAWADYDRDGLPDIYIANYETAESTDYFPDTLWRNNGDGTFADETLVAGINDDVLKHPGRGVAWCDFDNDFWPDVYVANYRLRPNYLWRNVGGRWFYDAALVRGVAGVGRNEDGSAGGPLFGHTIGAAWGDIDNDGNFDLFVANLAHKDAERGPYNDDSKLYLNSGPPRYEFRNIRAQAGIRLHDSRLMTHDPPSLFELRRGTPEPTADNRQPTTASVPRDELFAGAAFADFDNDGDLDLFVPQIYDLAHAQGRLYRNKGDLTFEEIAGEAGVRRIDTYAAAWADFDNDGCPDLVTAGREKTGARPSVKVFANTCTWGNHFVGAKLVGSRSNRMAIGAVMRVHAGGKVLTRQIEGGSGSHGQQNSPVLHFGLGKDAKIDKVEITWPSGCVETRVGVKIDALTTFLEPDPCPP
ncbi:MAG: CRTAC1 family protein [Deltaproteobacteria bacterium]|nr:CRTAC1 family protein [Deltaproteobacteria bacterium]